MFHADSITTGDAELSKETAKKEKILGLKNLKT
jgi:hypothetical protein